MKTLLNIFLCVLLLMLISLAIFCLIVLVEYCIEEGIKIKETIERKKRDADYLKRMIEKEKNVLTKVPKLVEYLSNKINSLNDYIEHPELIQYDINWLLMDYKNRLKDIRDYIEDL